MPLPRPCRHTPSRPGPSGPSRFPGPGQTLSPCLSPITPADPDLDELASQVTGAMVDAGIANIDDLWFRGQPLDRPLATLTRLAHAAARQNTAGLWTLIAWIHWRSNDRGAAWPALRRALDIDPDQDTPHSLAVFIYDDVDPARIPPVQFR